MSKHKKRNEKKPTLNNIDKLIYCILYVIIGFLIVIPIIIVLFFKESIIYQDPNIVAVKFDIQWLVLLPLTTTFTAILVVFTMLNHAMKKRYSFKKNLYLTDRYKRIVPLSQKIANIVIVFVLIGINTLFCSFSISDRTVITTNEIVKYNYFNQVKSLNSFSDIQSVSTYVNKFTNYTRSGPLGTQYELCYQLNWNDIEYRWGIRDFRSLLDMKKLNDNLSDIPKYTNSSFFSELKERTTYSADDWDIIESIFY